MDRFGRKPPLVVAYFTHATGFTLAGIGVSSASLATFSAGTLLFAAAFGTINLTRIGAAEMFPPAERGRGMAWIQISAIFGAITGPLLLVLSKPLGEMIGRAPLEFVWFLAPPLLVAAAFIVRGAEEPRVIAARVSSLRESPGAGQVVHGSTHDGRLILIGGVTLAASQAAMAAVMGVAGAAVTHAGHDVNVLGGLMFMHFIGMFGLSRVVGRLTDKMGRRATMTIGIALLACGGLVVALLQNAVGFGIGLLLVGFGWSFGFIGSSVLLTDVTEPARRARTVGRVDLAAQLSSAAIAVGGGWWFAQHGVAGLGVLAIAVAAVPLALLLTFIREKSPGIYARARAA
jgi:MFS family permease